MPQVLVIRKVSYLFNGVSSKCWEVFFSFSFFLFFCKTFRFYSFVLCFFSAKLKKDQWSRGPSYCTVLLARPPQRSRYLRDAILTFLNQEIIITTPLKPSPLVMSLTNMLRCTKNKTVYFGDHMWHESRRHMLEMTCLISCCFVIIMTLLITEVSVGPARPAPRFLKARFARL